MYRGRDGPQPIGAKVANVGTRDGRWSVAPTARPTEPARPGRTLSVPPTLRYL